MTFLHRKLDIIVIEVRRSETLWERIAIQRLDLVRRQFFRWTPCRQRRTVELGNAVRRARVLEFCLG
jgi:hypothetical protein